MDVVFCEVEGFDSLVEEYFGSDEAYNRFQMALMANPTMGNVIRGAGRLRKARWSGRGHGRRGGLRVIYVNVPEYGRILLVDVYAKSEEEDLTHEQRSILAGLAQDYVESLEQPRTRPKGGRS